MEEKNERPAIYETAARSAGQVAKDQLADLIVYKIRATLPVHDERRKGNLAVDHGDHEVGLTKGKTGGDARAAGQQPGLGAMTAIFQLLKEMEGQRE